MSIQHEKSDIRFHNSNGHRYLDAEQRRHDVLIAVDVFYVYILPRRGYFHSLHPVFKNETTKPRYNHSVFEEECEYMPMKRNCIKCSIKEGLE